MKTVVLISGRTCAGKSDLAKRLEAEYNYRLLKSTDLLKDVSAIKANVDRRALQAIGDRADDQTKSSWLFKAAMHWVENTQHSQWVIDSVRTSEQLQWFRRQKKVRVVHVHLYAPSEILEKRFEIKRITTKEDISYTAADYIKTEKDIDKFKADADVRINTGRADSGDVFVRVTAHLGLYSPHSLRCVDVIIGGQYGSEGKGHIAAYLAREYDVLVRVGGPNAGHTVSSESGVYTYHHLPSGSKDTDARILLGPGMTINEAELLKEIGECAVPPERLFIDPQAMIIGEDDRRRELGLVAGIGSTGRGGGAAAARRILERSSSTRLARDIPSLKPYVGETAPYRGEAVRILEDAYSRGHSVLLEGTQGSGLSLFHGRYPYVTSRDTNVAGCLAEAGISPGRVRRIILVVRSTPIRVGNPEGGVENGTSGYLKHETSFAEISRSAGLDAGNVLRNEKTSTTKRNRRVGLFDWELLRKSCVLNNPTDIVLTFADYMSAKNQEARRFEQLEENTIKFVEEIERVAQAPVSLINTRFPRKEGEMWDLRTVIDRRNWYGRRHAV